MSLLFGQMAGLGPLTVFAGTRDITHPDCGLLVSKARAAGVHTEFHQAPGMVHIYPLLLIPEGRAARRTMVRLLGERPWVLPPPAGAGFPRRLGPYIYRGAQAVMGGRAGAQNLEAPPNPCLP
ncbi:alpha/beta hydrolase [Paeniglutamicibacter psychrophenolicus]|uniref:alpha/beta hydrolase n=1 Tax=Paeniglutamicibacter psychrophenolicus TaxID=257454 RepID=UPI0027821786|nr:hypothetical protein [Paeniglutamicibacter psychrophenolicus]MDQ0092770.1 hypothetical protein [Paeniglutamicibacter psychrophenolicus]